MKTTTVLETWTKLQLEVGKSTRRGRCLPFHPQQWLDLGTEPEEVAGLLLILLKKSSKTFQESKFYKSLQARAGLKSNPTLGVLRKGS